MDATTLKQHRGAVKASVTRAITYVRGLDKNAETLSTLKNRRLLAEQHFNRFEELQQQLEEKCADEAELTIQIAEREDFEAKYLEVISSLDDIILEKSSLVVQPVTHHPTAPISHTRLPTLDLPSFNGDYTTWSSFHDLFSAMVHINAGLSGAQKLQFLKQALKGEAEGLLRAMPITDNNYAEAWQMLTARYDNKRQIISSHLKVLFSITQVSEESAAALRRILDSATESLRALKALGRHTQHWDDMTVHYLAERLDAKTREKWESQPIAAEFPTFNEFTSFMEERCRILEALQSTAATGKKKEQINLQRRIHSHVSTTQVTCVLCKEAHLLHQCTKFTSMNINERGAFVKKNSACFNCLRSGHGKKQCKSGSCRKCNGRHHTLLHFDKGDYSSQQQSNTSSSQQQSNTSLTQQPSGSKSITSATATTANTASYVLLSTAIIHIRDGDGNIQECRALLDSGSQASFITESCVQRLRLKKVAARIPLNGVAAVGAGTTTGFTTLSVSSKRKNYATTLEAFVLPKITCKLPSTTTEIGQWHHLQALELADPNFNRPEDIEILLGADIFMELLTPNQIPTINGSPAAQDTVFGWILAGKLEHHTPISSFPIITHVCSIEEDRLLTRFWETEEAPTSPSEMLTEEENQCEESFQSTNRRDPVSGRFIVQIPFKDKKVSLGSSRERAVRRLKQMECRFQQHPDHWSEYVKFMKEYLQLGHMEKVPATQLCYQHANYLPHHMVVKESSTSTKYRVVFNASSKTSNGKTLNDNMLTGAKLQDDLISILTRFRRHKVAFSADIAKMYRQVLIDPQHIDYQRILWRESAHHDIEEYRLLTVTYGTSSAPFLAIRCLKELAIQNKSKYPVAAEVVDKDFYVDDLMSGAENDEAAAELQTDLLSILGSAGMSLRKWSSNSQTLLQNLPESFRETKIPFQLDKDEAIKTLGVAWDPAHDVFTFQVNLEVDEEPLTKRRLLSDIARLFDPLGWIAPVIITAKIMLQQLWLLGLGWDDILPESTANRWNSFKSQLQELDKLKIRRYTGEINNNVQVHGFSDSSEQAISACVYLRTITDGEVRVTLISAKTRVAPIQQVSLPRLELCGAVLLTKLVRNVLNSFQIPTEKVHLWTDSTVVLCWLQQHPIKWKSYVAVRISKIQSLFPAHHWRHVISSENPADVASRGIFPSEILTHPMWFTGAPWLQQTEDNFPHQTIVKTEANALREIKMTKLRTHTTILASDHILFKFSSFCKLQRVIGWTLRFQRKARKQATPVGALTTQELQRSRNCIIKLVQASSFPKEVERSLQHMCISKKSQLKKLNPFMDNDGLLRVGGRLKNSQLSENRKHPIILPKKHHITSLLIDQAHVSTLHGGTQVVQSTLLQQFWIPGARSTIQQHIHNCQTCFKHRPVAAQQLMGNIPKSRLEPARPFLKVGIDYAGPVNYKLNQGRGQKSRKGYIAVFVCMTTRAIHLEFVSDLTTAAFIAALQRMTSRRGLCKEIYSDCGSNFLGAKRELNELRRLVSSQRYNLDLQTQLSKQSIQWNMSPPGSPHFNGISEAAVKSSKHHLKRVMSAALFTFEEVSTLLCKIEAVLNSRPLTPLTSDPDDLEALTPGHFLVGHPMNEIPNPDLTAIKLNRLSRWQLIQQQLQQFWKRWSLEYISTLQQRHKWKEAHRNIKVGELALIRDERLPPYKWSMGRVLEVFPGQDAQVRVVKLKTQNGELTRPVVKLCPLPLNE